jgi:release factor glutamine methyltransferase
VTRAAAATPLRDALQGAVAAIEAAGAETPRLDAELLLEAASGWSRAAIASDPDRGLPPAVAREFAAMVRRRVRREPVAYILGRKGFWTIELEVDRRALIPRPETELLVEVAEELAPSSVLDVGTGSGAVALAVAAELPEARVTATDTSPEALDLARANAGRFDLGSRVTVAAGSVPPGEYGLLLANLPYVSEADWESLEPEIREFEPREALVAGPTGLESIEALLAELGLPGRVADAIALELGEGQAPRVSELVREAGYPRVEARRDLAGIERVVVGRR